MPHARIEGLDRYFGMFARLNRPIHFDSVDAKPVDLVFLLLTPATVQGEHLAALAAVSRHLRDKEFAARLRKAANTAALCSLLCDPHHSVSSSELSRDGSRQRVHGFTNGMRIYRD